MSKYGHKHEIKKTILVVTPSQMAFIGYMRPIVREGGDVTVINQHMEVMINERHYIWVRDSDRLRGYRAAHVEVLNPSHFELKERETIMVYKRLIESELGRGEDV